MARLRKGRANTAHGAAHFLRETISRARYAGTSHRPTHAAGRQRLLPPRHRRLLPQDECPLLHHRAPAQNPAQHHRGHPRGGLDAQPFASFTISPYPSGGSGLTEICQSSASSRRSKSNGRFGYPWVGRTGKVDGNGQISGDGPAPTSLLRVPRNPSACCRFEAGDGRTPKL